MAFDKKPYDLNQLLRHSMAAFGVLNQGLMCANALVAGIRGLVPPLPTRWCRLPEYGEKINLGKYWEKSEFCFYLRGYY
jgi:hypothetical protein